MIIGPPEADPIRWQAGLSLHGRRPGILPPSVLVRVPSTILPVSVIVTRSPLRLLAYVVIGVAAVLVAVDMTISNRFYPMPETFERVVGTAVDEVGEMVNVTARVPTDQGRAHLRRDRVVGVVLFAGGVSALGWAMKELIWPRVLLRGDEEGIAIHVDGPGMPLRQIPWSDIAEVRSGLIEEEGESLPALSIRFHHPEMVPEGPASAVAAPPWLHLIADEWVPPAHMVSPLLERVWSTSTDLRVME